MQNVIAQQLILFSFFASLTFLTLVAAIMAVSIALLARIQRLEVAYSYANRLPATPAYRSQPKSSSSTRDTRPKRLLELMTNENKSVDIQITPIEANIKPSRYKPTASPNLKEKVS